MIENYERGKYIFCLVIGKLSLEIARICIKLLPCPSIHPTDPKTPLYTI